MPVKGHSDAARLERFEGWMILEQVGVGEAEHSAGIPMPGQYRQPAVVVALFIAIGIPGCFKRRIPGFPPPVTDDTPQHPDNTEQSQENKPRNYHKVKLSGI